MLKTTENTGFVANPKETEDKAGGKSIVNNNMVSIVRLLTKQIL